MDIIESIKKDKAYLKCKAIVKTWEKDFKIKFARTPSKFDIKEAPAKIKYAYKKYFHLKSAALENSLSFCEFDESIGSPEPVRHFESIGCESLNSVPDKLPDLPSGKELHDLLSNSTKELQSAVKSPSPFVDSLSKKLFQNRKFSLRNPRKTSLSKSFCGNETKQSNENSFQDTCIPISPKKENKDIQIKFDHESKNSQILLQPINKIESVSNVRQLDEAWLERAIGLPSQQIQECSNNVPDKFGLSNIKLPNLKEKPLDFVENSESEDDDKDIGKLKPALKKRKTDSQTNSSNNIDRHSGCLSENVKIGIIKHKNFGTPPKKSKTRAKFSKNSINDEEHPPDISEYLPFGLENDLAPRHGNVSNITKVIIDQSVNPTQINRPDCTEVNKLETKIKNGTLNDNFVKINIEKKVFVRGKKNVNFTKYKKQQWKDKKALHAGMEFPESGKVICFKCGQTGHMARYCVAQRGDSLLPLESYDENDLPSLEDMQSMVFKEDNDISDQLSQTIYEPTPVPDSVMEILKQTQEITCTKSVKPIYLDPLQVNSNEIYGALVKFGHNQFRPGQEEAIKRILCGMSTLLILSTGSGKSLCYQLPAYIYSQRYRCITLVISPLVSLMEDQVLGMPDFLKAGCLHTNQPPTQRRKILQCIKDGDINILLISPEALISGDTSNSFTGLFKSLPQIAFACIDEVHCVSQWSHNFRPSYLMISRVLQEKLNVKCILGLTATASQQTIRSVITHINVPDGLSGVITSPTLPENLCLSVSFEKDKDRALVSFLTTDRISTYNSIIVYCIRRDECQRVAALLRSCLQEPHKIDMERQNTKRKRMSYIAEAYHAGMSAAQRKIIQKRFMNGTLRIIVATVAFGMGINKSNIRCIIHYNMPSSFESYVQEVGRAGRDGKNANCHVFMSNSNGDKNELLKHIHANTIDRPIIRKLLQKVFIPCDCSSLHDDQSASTSLTSSRVRCKGHEVGIPIDSTIEELDLPSENIATLLCYVELHSKQYIKVLSNAYTMCKISSYGGPGKILEATKSCKALAMAYLLESKKDKNVMTKNVLEFNVIEVAAAIGWESGMTKYHLKNLEWITEGGLSKRSLLKVEFNKLGFRIRAPGDLSPSELDSILDDIHQLVTSQEKIMLYQLEEISQTLGTLGNYSLENNELSDNILLQKSNALKTAIRHYFLREDALPTNIVFEERPLDVDRVRSDVCALITSYKDCCFTGRSIARIFQGISSPNYPAMIWGRCRFWRSHIHEDFNGIVKIATQQIIQMKIM